MGRRPITQRPARRSDSAAMRGSSGLAGRGGGAAATNAPRHQRPPSINIHIYWGKDRRGGERSVSAAAGGAPEGGI